MPRRSWKTVNIPTEFVQWLDARLAAGRVDPARAPMGIVSRDEFFRVAGAMLAAALLDEDSGKIPLEEINKILRRIRRGP